MLPKKKRLRKSSGKGESERPGGFLDALPQQNEEKEGRPREEKQQSKSDRHFTPEVVEHFRGRTSGVSSLSGFYGFGCRLDTAAAQACSIKSCLDSSLQVCLALA